MGQVSRFQEKQQNRRQKAIFNIAFTLVLVTVGIVTYQLFTLLIHQRKQLLKKKVTKIEEKKTEDKETAKIEEEN